MVEEIPELVAELFNFIAGHRWEGQRPHERWQEQAQRLVFVVMPTPLSFLSDIPQGAFSIHCQNHADSLFLIKIASPVKLIISRAHRNVFIQALCRRIMPAFCSAEDDGI